MVLLHYLVKLVKKLSYRRGTARRSMLVSSCCFTRYGG